MQINKLLAMFPELPVEVIRTSGLLLGVGVRRDVKQLVYLWAGQPISQNVDAPAYLLPVGDKRTFWKSTQFKVWSGLSPALIGLVQVGQRRVTVFDYAKIVHSLRDQHLDMSEGDLEEIVQQNLSQLLQDDFGENTPMILYTPDLDLESLIYKEPPTIALDGSFEPPPPIPQFVKDTNAQHRENI